MAILLTALLVAAIAMTYLVPRGSFGVLPDGSADYLSYTRRSDLGGIPLWRGLLAPVLVFFSEDGLTLAMLSLFLFVIAAAFQVMNDSGGVQSLVSAVSRRFSSRRGLLLICISFLFYCFGAFLGLFEEMLTMLPIVASLCLALGYDSFTGFLCSILACGFGFASAVTNPFTVLLASEIIGVSPMTHVWFRLIIFAVMFLLLIAFLGLYLRRLERDPSRSVTRRHDSAAAESAAAGQEAPSSPRVRNTYAVFLLAALGIIMVSSLLPALRSYTVVILIVWFLFGGIAAGAIACGALRPVLRSFGKGFVSALPTLVFIAMAASIKYTMTEGHILDSLLHMAVQAAGRMPKAGLVLFIYLICLVMNFFIASGSAKAFLLIPLIAPLAQLFGVSTQLCIVAFAYGDGFSNVFYPTNAALLIALGLADTGYGEWARFSWKFQGMNLLLTAALLLFGLAVGY